MKKIITILLILAITLLAKTAYAFNILDWFRGEPKVGATVLFVPQGGTGASSFTAGECLVGNGTGAITTQACGSGGGGADGNWTFFNNSGIRLATTTNQVVIGKTATSSLAQLEVNHNMLVANEVKANYFNATSTATSTLPNTWISSLQVGSLFETTTIKATSTATSTIAGALGIGTTSPVAKLQVGNWISNSVDTNILSSRAVNDTGSGNAHGFSDSSDISRSGTIGYSAYDSRVTFSGANDYDHFVSLQAAPTLNGSGTFSNLYGVYTANTVNSGTVTNNYGMFMNNPTGAGTITNNYGLYVQNQTKGASKNYAIFTEAGAPLYFGDNVTVNGHLGAGTSWNAGYNLFVLGGAYIASSTSGGEKTALVLANQFATDGTASALGWNVSSNAATLTGKIVNKRIGSGNYGLSFQTYGGSGLVDALNIIGSGNIGMATSSPFARLSLGGGDTTTTMIGADAVTGFTGNLLDLKVASSTKFKIDGNGLLTILSASTTLFSSDYASSTKYFGADLQTCNAITGKLSWANGVFTCATDQNTGGGTGGPGTVATSATPTIGNLAYWTSTGLWPETLGTVATSTLTATSPLALSQPISVIGSAASALSLGTVGIANGGTNSTSISPNSILWFNGTSIMATSSQLTVGSILATTTATSTFLGGIEAKNLKISDITSGILKVDATGGFAKALSGTDYQAGDGTLTSLAGLTVVQGDIIYGSGSDTFSILNVGTDGYILGVSAGLPAWIASTTIPLGGDVTGTLSATVVGDDSHAHTGATLSGIDISADTNLTAGDNLTLTDDDIDLDATLSGLTGITSTGAIDFGGAVLEISNGTNPTADDVGELAHDTTDNQLILDDYVIGTAVVPIWQRTVGSTTPEFVNGGLLPLTTKLDGYTITAIRCKVDGGTSKVIAIEDADTNSTEDITCGTTVTSDDGSITNATVTAAEEMYIDFGATSGTVNYVSISVFGTVTRE